MAHGDGVAENVREGKVGEKHERNVIIRRNRTRNGILFKPTEKKTRTTMRQTETAHMKRDIKTNSTTTQQHQQLNKKVLQQNRKYISKIRNSRNNKHKSSQN